MDPAAIFWAIQRQYNSQTFVAASRMFASEALRRDLIYTIVVAPVIEASRLFEIDPAPRPPKQSWRWIIPVRWGRWDDSCCWGNSATTPEQREALNGLYIDDLVACDPKLRTVTSTLLGVAEACGHPRESYWADGPVHVHESPLAWLLARGSGVFLCGDAAQQQQWLRDCAAGITVGSVAMGEAIARKMRRPVPALPEIKVYA